jgi:hypothetical protein
MMIISLFPDPDYRLRPGQYAKVPRRPKPGRPLWWYRSHGASARRRFAVNDRRR